MTDPTKFYKPDQVGESLRQGAQRWKARYNPTTGAWHLLDLWHESLASMSPDDAIPDGSPALRVVQADAFEAVLDEAKRIGVLSRWVGPPAPTSSTASVEGAKISSEAVSPPGKDNTVALRALGTIERIVALDNSRRLGEG